MDLQTHNRAAVTVRMRIEFLFECFIVISRALISQTSSVNWNDKVSHVCLFCKFSHFFFCFEAFYDQTFMFSRTDHGNYHRSHRNSIKPFAWTWVNLLTSVYPSSLGTLSSVVFYVFWILQWVFLFFSSLELPANLRDLLVNTRSISGKTHNKELRWFIYREMFTFLAVGT